MTGRRVYMCPRCGSVASHLRSGDGLRVCENEECRHVGRTATFRRGGPRHPRSHWSIPDGSMVPMQKGSFMKIPMRYDDA